MLDSILHWLTCKHREVHRLSLPESLNRVESKEERDYLRECRNPPAFQGLLASLQTGLEKLSVPTPGPKDVTTG